MALRRDNEIGAPPVVRDELVIGIVTEPDVFRAFSQLFDLSATGARVTSTFRNTRTLYPSSAVQSLKDGAFDFLTKPFRDQDLSDHINDALKQDAENRAAIDKHADLRRRAESLTPREREVLDLIVEGKANKVVTIELSLSERTVEIQRANAMEKMGMRSVAHLVEMHLTLNEQ